MVVVVVVVSVAAPKRRGGRILVICLLCLLCWGIDGMGDICLWFILLLYISTSIYIYITI